MRRTKTYAAQTYYFNPPVRNGEIRVKITRDSIRARPRIIGVMILSAADGFLAIPSRATEAAFD